MATTYSDITSRFLKRIEKDRSFFCYLNLSNSESAAIVSTRATDFLHEALGRMMAEGCPEVDFSDYNDTTETIAADLTLAEKYLIVLLMYETYLERDVSKLKCLSVNYTSTDLRVFDPSSARTSFFEILGSVKEECLSKLDLYRSTNRSSGRYQGIDYSAYNEEDE